MTLLTPEDLRTLPQYSNLLQSNFWNSYVKIILKSAFNSCRHHKEQRVDRGKQRGQRLRHWENIRVVSKWKTVQRIGCSWCALLDHSPWRQRVHKTLSWAQLWRIKRGYPGERRLLNGQEIFYMSGTTMSPSYIIFSLFLEVLTKIIQSINHSHLVPLRLAQRTARRT
jgi:hypothetical protein